MNFNFLGAPQAKPILRWTAGILLVFGLSLHSFTALFKSAGGLTGFSVGLWAWSLLPYAAGAFALLRARRPLAACGWLIPSAIADTIAYNDVFFHPEASTAGLGLLFTPIWNLVAFGPIGSVIGLLIERTLEKADAQ